MTSEFALVPLNCPTCGAGVRAEGEDVVFYCTACRNGFLLDPERGDLRPLTVSFVAATHVAADLYKPFWLLPARVSILERSAKGRGFGGLLGFLFGSDEGDARSREGTFAVPAFHASLETVRDLTLRYSQAVPELEEKLAERLLGGRYGVDDAEKLAHYALLATEIGKPDTLTQLRYEMVFGSPRLLGVPFVRRHERLHDALHGIVVSA